MKLPKLTPPPRPTKEQRRTNIISHPNWGTKVIIASSMDRICIQLLEGQILVGPEFLVPETAVFQPPTTRGGELEDQRLR